MGQVFDWSNEQYHAHAAVSRSMLQELKKSPYHYYYKYLSGLYEQEELTPSLIIGDCVHTCFLEPEKANDRYIQAPDINKRTKAGKEEWAAFEEEHKDKIIMTEHQMDETSKMVASLINNEYAVGLVENAQIEKSILFAHETGIQCKVRPDAWRGELVVDLKTTADASYRAFQNSAYKFGYYLQAGMINQALKSLDIEMQRFVFVCVENKEPYATAVYILDRDAIEYGVAQFDDLMGRLAKHVETNSWPAYDVQVLHLPNYANYD